MSPLIGHDAATAVFLQRWQAGRLPPAWLVQGGQGIGKATWATQAAVFLLTHYGTAPASDSLFGEALPPVFPVAADSAHARYVAQDAHPDFLSLTRPVDAKTGRRKQDIPAEMLRAAKDFLAKTPAQARCKVVLIDSVDETNTAGANALLKNIEEPRPHTFFFLINHTPAKLLPTLRSRCLRLPLAPLSYAAFARILQARDVVPDGMDITALYRLCHGAVGKALALLEGEDDRAITLHFLHVLTDISTLSLADTLAAIGKILKHSQPSLLLMLFTVWMQHSIKERALAGQSPARLDAALMNLQELLAASRLNLDAEMVWLDSLTQWQRAVTSSA